MAEIYDRYSSVVYAVALRVLGDTGAAEDVLQEVFLQLWRRPGAFDAARGSLGSWLAVITRNRAIDSLRKRRPETDIEDVVLSVAPDLAADAERTRAAEKVRGVMGGMAPAQRTRDGLLGRHEPFGDCEQNWRAAGNGEDADSHGFDRAAKGVSELRELGSSGRGRLPHIGARKLSLGRR
jgi:RNA polymerase sigma factor (sigma-70 family)